MEAARLRTLSRCLVTLRLRCSELLRGGLAWLLAVTEAGDTVTAWYSASAAATAAVAAAAADSSSSRSARYVSRETDIVFR